LLNRRRHNLYLVGHLFGGIRPTPDSQKRVWP
jgi:hypothetical protein